MVRGLMEAGRDLLFYHSKRGNNGSVFPNVQSLQ
jgi:hypothetical protein